MTPTLIYCAAGNKRLADIAITYGFKFGAQLPATIYHPPYFTDQNWKTPNREGYMKAVAQYRPALATVLDWEREEQLPEVLAWAEEAAQYVTDSVIIIPKVQGRIDAIPREIGGKPVRLGYSVPTKFAGTELPIWEFRGYPIHLLGGSPRNQIVLRQYMNVKSADGNYIQKQAVQRNQFFVPSKVKWSSNGHFPRLTDLFMGGIGNDAPYHAFKLSCINFRNAWDGLRYSIAYGVAQDIEAIDRIARQYPSELGFLRKIALKEAMEKFEVFVAFINDQLVGFVHWHQRRDGWSTIYDIAVDRSMKRSGVGRALLTAIPKPIRLKCVVGNSAEKFYEAMGMNCVGQDAGKKRPLNIFELEKPCL